MQKLKPIEKNFSIYLGSKGSGRTTGCIAAINEYILACKKRKLKWHVVVITNDLDSYEKSFKKKQFGFPLLKGNISPASEHVNKITLINSINQSVESINTAIDIKNLKEGLIIYDTATIPPFDFIWNNAIVLRSLNVGLIITASSLDEINPRVYQNLRFVKWSKAYHSGTYFPETESTLNNKYIHNIELFQLAERCLFTGPINELTIDIKNDYIICSDYAFYTGCINYAESQLKKFDHEGVLFMAQKLANLSRYAISKGNK